MITFDAELKAVATKPDGEEGPLTTITLTVRASAVLAGLPLLVGTPVGVAIDPMQLGLFERVDRETGEIREPGSREADQQVRDALGSLAADLEAAGHQVRRNVPARELLRSQDAGEPHLHRHPDPKYPTPVCRMPGCTLEPRYAVPAGELAGVAA